MLTFRQWLAAWLRRTPQRARRSAPSAARRAKVLAGTRRVDLALQGGGSHGAFTWGVLDRLLEDDGLDVGAVSGTSAGALNAAVLATGLARGGRQGARAALAAFWRDVGHEGALAAPFSVNPAADGAAPFDVAKLPGVAWASHALRAFSPYELNPLDLNPLRALVTRHVDGAALRGGALPLFITATHVNTGQARVFSGAELSIDVLLASACIPTLFRAVEIGGEAYWDGGYTANPALYPLVYRTDALAILVVRINPLLRAGATPMRSVDILERVGEISFNASFLAEMRAIAFVTRLAREGAIDAGRYQQLRLHMVADDAALSRFGAASKLNADGRFLDALCQLGRDAADAWLAQHRDDIGVRSSFDVEQAFLAPHGLAAAGAAAG